jgi:hypothetical protein
MDTVSGAGSCIVTLVERASGYVLIDKLRAQHFSVSAQSAAIFACIHACGGSLSREGGYVCR